MCRLSKEKKPVDGLSTILPIVPWSMYIRCMDNKATKMLNSQATSAAIYKQLFTDVEWDAISSAMEDYSDYGDCEANIADRIQAKIAKIYELTSNDWLYQNLSTFLWTF